MVQHDSNPVTAEPAIDAPESAAAATDRPATFADLLDRMLVDVVTDAIDDAYANSLRRLDFNPGEPDEQTFDIDADSVDRIMGGLQRAAVGDDDDNAVRAFAEEVERVAGDTIERLHGQIMALNRVRNWAAWNTTTPGESRAGKAHRLAVAMIWHLYEWLEAAAIELTPEDRRWIVRGVSAIGASAGKTEGEVLIARIQEAVEECQAIIGHIEDTLSGDSADGIGVDIRHQREILEERLAGLQSLPALG